MTQGQTREHHEPRIRRESNLPMTLTWGNRPRIPGGPDAHPTNSALAFFPRNVAARRIVEMVVGGNFEPPAEYFKTRKAFRRTAHSRVAPIGDGCFPTNAIHPIRDRAGPGGPCAPARKKPSGRRPKFSEIASPQGVALVDPPTVGRPIQATNILMEDLCSFSPGGLFCPALIEPDSRKSPLQSLRTPHDPVPTRQRRCARKHRGPPEVPLQ